MQYTEYIFRLVPQMADAEDVLSAMLGECGFETFCNDGVALKGYVQTNAEDRDAIMSAVQVVGQMMAVEISVDSHAAPNENWNAAWEAEGFRPIVVDTRLVVHSTDHTDVPLCSHDIKINPCMAFGTGTHDTTRMLLTWLLEHDLSGKRVVDAGCGTGILGILAMMRGAASVLAYDIDEWSSENAKKNFALNGLQADVRLGDSSVIEGERCDLLVANINRNILLADMPRFAQCLDKGGTLLISGFYRDDADVLKARATELGLACDGCGDGVSEWHWLQFGKR